MARAWLVLIPMGMQLLNGCIAATETELDFWVTDVKEQEEPCFVAHEDVAGPQCWLVAVRFQAATNGTYWADGDDWEGTSAGGASLPASLVDATPQAGNGTLLLAIDGTHSDPPVSVRYLHGPDGAVDRPLYTGA